MVFSLYLTIRYTLWIENINLDIVNQNKLKEVTFSMNMNKHRFRFFIEFWLKDTNTHTIATQLKISSLGYTEWHLTYSLFKYNTIILKS